MKRLLPALLACVLILLLSASAWADGFADVQQGRKAAEEGEYERALTFLNRALDSGSLTPEQTSQAYCLRGNVYMEQKKEKEALDDFSRAVDSNPENPMTYYYRGNAYAGMGNSVSALMDINRAIDLKPDFADAYFTRGRLHYNRDANKAALEDLNKTLSLEPNHADALFFRGMTYLALRQVDPAISDMKKCLELEPGSFAARIVLKELLAVKEKREKQKTAGDTPKKQAKSGRQQPELTSPAEKGLMATVKDQPRSRYDRYLDAVAVVLTDKGMGSGFFINDEGLMVTNQHVVKEQDMVIIKLRNGKKFQANVIARDRQGDLAILYVYHCKPERYLELATARQGGVGTEVIAIGTPEGLSWSISRGIISAIRDKDGVRVVQTDAALNSGNSGGPLLLKHDGRVVGINTFILQGTEGLNFAVSVSRLKDLLAKEFALAPGETKPNNLKTEIPAKWQPKPVQASVEYHGNTANQVFHRSGCRYYDCKNCTKVFSSREDALAAGYKPCGVCKP